MKRALQNVVAVAGLLMSINGRLHVDVLWWGEVNFDTFNFSCHVLYRSDKSPFSSLYNACLESDLKHVPVYWISGCSVLREEITDRSCGFDYFCTTTVKSTVFIYEHVTVGCVVL